MVDLAQLIEESEDLQAEVKLRLADAGPELVLRAKQKAGSYRRLEAVVGCTAGYWSNVAIGRFPLAPGAAARLLRYTAGNTKE